MIRHCVDFTDYKELNLDIFRYRMQYLEAEYNGKLFAILTHKQLADFMGEYNYQMVLTGVASESKTTIMGYPILLVEEGQL